jgi:hypothetical protein
VDPPRGRRLASNPVAGALEALEVPEERRLDRAAIHFAGDGAERSPVIHARKN